MNKLKFLTSLKVDIQHSSTASFSYCSYYNYYFCISLFSFPVIFCCFMYSIIASVLLVTHNLSLLKQSILHCLLLVMCTIVI